MEDGTVPRVPQSYPASGATMLRPKDHQRPILHLPAGNFTVCYGKLPFIVDFATEHGVFSIVMFMLVYVRVYYIFHFPIVFLLFYYGCPFDRLIPDHTALG